MAHAQVEGRGGVEWLRGLLRPSEIAEDFFARIRRESLATGISFLDDPGSSEARPLRPGSIVEVAGPSGSGKTEVLTQIAAACLCAALDHHGRGTAAAAPRWRVVLFDLDLRFDASRLAAAVRRRVRNAIGTEILPPEEDALVRECLRDCEVLHCRSSLHFIAGVKALAAKLQKDSQKEQMKLPLILIDSVGAFYWMDRAFLRDPGQSSAFGAALPLSAMMEVVARELRSLCDAHRVLVVAAKCLLFTSGPPARGPQEQAQWHRPWREHMPRAWQACVDHRLLVTAGVKGSDLTFAAKWDVPIADEVQQQSHQHGSFTWRIEEGCIVVEPG